MANILVVQAGENEFAGLVTIQSVPVAAAAEVEAAGSVGVDSWTIEVGVASEAERSRSVAPPVWGAQFAPRPNINIGRIGHTGVSNTTAETVIATFSTPAGTLNPSWGLRSSLTGGIVASSSGTLTLRIKSLVSGTSATLFESTGMTFTSTGTRHWRSEFSSLALSTASQRHGASFSVTSPSTGTTAPVAHHLVGESTGGIDSADTPAYRWTAQWDRASTALEAHVTLGTMELLR